MKTNEIILKAKSICSKYFNIRSIEFKHEYNWTRPEIKSERLEITVFYSQKNVPNSDTNFTTTVYVHSRNFSVRAVLNELKNDVEKLSHNYPNDADQIDVETIN